MKKIKGIFIFILIAILYGCASNTEETIKETTHISVSMLYDYNFKDQIKISVSYSFPHMDIELDEVIEYGVIVVSGNPKSDQVITLDFQESAIMNSSRIVETEYFIYNCYIDINTIDLYDVTYNARAYLKYDLNNQEETIYSINIANGSYKSLKTAFDKMDDKYASAIAKVISSDETENYYSSLLYVWMNMSDGDIIYLLVNEYNEMLIVDHDDIKVYGNNKGIDPNNEQRKSETTIYGGMYLNGENIEIDGIALADKVEIVIENSVILKNILTYDANIFSIIINAENVIENIEINNCSFNMDVTSLYAAIIANGQINNFLIKQNIFVNFIGQVLDINISNECDINIIDNVFTECGTINIETNTNSTIKIKYNEFTTSVRGLLVINHNNASIEINYNKFLTKNIVYLSIIGGINKVNMHYNYFASSINTMNIDGGDSTSMAGFINDIISNSYTNEDEVPTY